MRRRPTSAHLGALAAWWALIAACGLSGGDDERELTDEERIAQLAALAAAEEQTAEAQAPPFQLTVNDHGLECPRTERPRVHCAVHVQHWNGDGGLTRSELYLAGPVGTRIVVGPIDHTLSAADDAQVHYASDLRTVREADARVIRPFPTDEVLSHLDGVCTRTGEPPSLAVRMELPGRAPIETRLVIPWTDVHRMLTRRVEQVLEGEAEMSAPTGNVVLRGGGCANGNITRLSDIGYLARSRTITRRGSCGTYGNSRGSRLTVGKYMYDEQLELWDLRSRRRIAQRRFRAPNPECPSRVSSPAGMARSVSSSVDSMQVIAWFAEQIARVSDD